MTLWLLLGAMTLAGAVCVLWPFLGRRAQVASRRDYELEVYRAQLDELEREAARGLIGEAEAASARLELQRRMLAVDAAEKDAVVGRRRGGLVFGSIAALVLTGSAIGVYAVLGSPGLSDQPLARRADEQPGVAGGGPTPDGAVPSVPDMIARLEERVRAQPDDLEAWLRLGRAFELSRDPARAADAYGRALELDDSLAPLHAAYAEARILNAGGVVTEPAMASLERALELDPAEPRARFYRGVGLAQRGERQAALDVWVDLAWDSTADAPWLPMLEERIRTIAADLDLDAASLLPERAPAATAPAGPPVAAEAEPLPADPAAVRAEAADLASRLEQEPKDWQGWIRLARMRAALDQPEAAQAALQRGAEAYAGAPFVLQQFQSAAVDLGLAAPAGGDGRRGPTPEQMQAAAQMSPEEQQEMIRGMVDGLAARLETDPDDLEGWLMLGRSWRVLGETDRSIQAFRQALDLLPENAPQRAELQATIDALEAGG